MGGWADTYAPAPPLVRTGYAYEPPALCTYRRRRAACPQGPTPYGAHVPALGAVLPQIALNPTVTLTLTPTPTLTVVPTRTVIATLTLALT